MPPMIIVSLVVAVVTQVAAAADVFPGKSWARRTPVEVGLDKSKLDAFGKLAGGRGCVIRYGTLVYTWGDYRRRGDVASAAKPVYSHFLFKAVEDKRIKSLDEKVEKYEPRLAKLNPQLGHPDANITWRHLANQISCYGVREKPGTAYDYSDWQMALFWDLLFTKIYKADYKTVDEKVLRPMLTDVLDHSKSSAGV
ncbi:MAG: serine hydrolase [Planctomycetes bacterium]|nr:serine hydrolase [Planctomycetota bacterium]